MPSLSRAYYEAQSIEEVFLRRQMQHIAVATDKHPLTVDNSPFGKVHRRHGVGAAGSPTRARGASPSALSVHTLRAIGGRPMSKQALSRAPTAPATGMSWAGGNTGPLTPQASYGADLWASGPAGIPLSRQPTTPLALPLASPPAPQTAPPGIQRQPPSFGGTQTLEIPSAPLLGSVRGVVPDPDHERAARDARLISDLRAEVDTLRSRLHSLENLVRHVNVEYTLELQGRLQDSFGSINTRLTHLDGHLLTEIQKREVRSATLMAASARGFVARCRYRRARNALSDWRRRALQSTANLLLGWVLRMRAIEAQIQRIERSAALHLLERCTKAWRGYTLGQLPARGELARVIMARRHYQGRLQLVSFQGWQRVVRSARIAGMRYVFRGNKRVALREGEVRIMQTHLAAWRQVTTALQEAERRFRQVERRLQGLVLQALRGWVSRARALRLVTLERWVELMKRRSELPFRAWFLHTVDRKIVRRSQEALTSAFKRRLNRNLLNRIVTMWFDLAVHKRVEIRSRAQLIKALQEQEDANTLVEDNMREYSLVLQEAEVALQREDIKQKAMQAQMQDLEQEVVSMRLAVHASQQESLKLRATLRNYEIRFPNAFREPGVVPEPLREMPLVISADDNDLLKRLRWAVEAQVYDAAYVPPPKAETPADRELRRLQRFLAYILKGQMPDGARVDEAAVTDEKLRDLIDKGELEVPEELEAEELRTRIPTQADGGEALQRAEAVPVRAALSAWAPNPFAAPDPAEEEAQGTLLRSSERALKWSDIAQGTGVILQPSASSGLASGVTRAERARRGVERRIQEAKEWKFKMAQRKVNPETGKVEAQDVYNMTTGDEEAEMLTADEKAERRRDILKGI